MNPGFFWILKALLSHYWRHPWQTLFLCIGLVAGVGLWSAVQIINQHAEASYQQAQNLLGAQANYWTYVIIGHKNCGANNWLANLFSLSRIR